MWRVVAIVGDPETVAVAAANAAGSDGCPGGWIGWLAGCSGCSCGKTCCGVVWRSCKWVRAGGCYGCCGTGGGQNRENRKIHCNDSCGAGNPHCSP